MQGIFQFHYGSIKSLCAIADKSEQIPISIPLWFD